MKTVTFSAVKGGVGKSSLAIFTANILAASGYKVLALDADPQNSMTFFYRPDSVDDRENLAEILVGGKVGDNIIAMSAGKPDLIPSSLELIACRSCDVYALREALREVRNDFDFCVIDTAPNFDNVTVNGLEAADIIVTPVQFSNFDYKSAVFYRGLVRDLGLIDRWRIVFNRTKPVRSAGSLYYEYLTLYKDAFGKNILQSRVPESAAVRQYFDAAGKITKAKTKINVFNALLAFASETTGVAAKPDSF